MGAVMCDQRIRRYELKRELASMNPRSGLRRQLLDLFYEDGTRWTWHTLLGLVLVGLPYACVVCICVCLAFVLFLPALALMGLLDTLEGVLRWFSDLAFDQYRRVLQEHDAIIATGKCTVSHQTDSRSAARTIS